MRKRLCIIMMGLVLSIAAQAQRIVFDVIAQVPYDARTQQYGKMEPRNMRIIKRGDETIYIGADKYTVVEVVERKNEPTVQYVQYTAIGEAGEECTIKVCHDGTAEHAVMQDYVLVFDNAHIYDWTFYFTDEGTQEER